MAADQVKVRNIVFYLFDAAKGAKCTYLGVPISFRRLKRGKGGSGGCLSCPGESEASEGEKHHIFYLPGAAKVTNTQLTYLPPAPSASRFDPAVYCCVVCTPK